MRSLLFALLLAPWTASAQTADLHLRPLERSAQDAARVAAITAPTDDFTVPERFEANQGGAGTVRRRADRQAFSLPQANLDFGQEGDFLLGNGLFEKLWVAAPASTIASDGLGPMFNARSCQSCHLKDGRGHAPTGPDDDATSLVVRLGRPIEGADLALGDYLASHPDPILGRQFSDRSLPGQPAEGRVSVVWEEAETIALAGGASVTLRRPRWTLQGAALHPETMISARVAPQMIGLGLLEAIPAQDILAHADPEDADGDGISGRANFAWSDEFDAPLLGRFGVRATTPTLRQQAANAFNADIGIASPLQPDPAGDCTNAQTACRAGPHGMDANQDGYEVSGAGLDLVTFYTANLGVPRRAAVDTPEVLAGKQAFYGAGCIDCHVPKFVTHRLNDRLEQSFQLIWPYTDMLVHDMGPGLADGLPAGLASGSEWRTPPLWGLGLTEQVTGVRQFLHDGRARSLAEAILWHGGEAQTARDTYIEMEPDLRDALHAFLESL